MYFSQKAFTLVEIVITVAILAVVATISVAGLGGYRTGKNVESEANEIAAAIRATQRRAATQENGSAWGIRFSNAGAGLAQTYTTFSGTSYAAGIPERTFTLRNGVQFTSPAAGSTKDLTLQAVTGNTASAFSVTIVGVSGGYTKTISIDTTGVVTIQ